jgi:hypothetical protein
MERKRLLIYLWVILALFVVIGFLFYKNFISLLWKSMFSFNGFALLVSRVFTFLIVSRILFIAILVFLVLWLVKLFKSKSDI